MTQMRIKQGQPLSISLVIRDQNGAPIDATTCTFASQLRSTIGALVATLNFVPMGGPGQAVAIVLGTDTANWAPGLLMGDVFITTGGVVVPSLTFVIYVVRAITT